MKADLWTHRVPRAPAALRQLGEAAADAAHDLAEGAGHPPGKPGLAMQNVTQVLLLATAVASATLAACHLYKALCGKHAAPRHGGHPGHGTEERPAGHAGQAAGRGRRP
jgi:hypothetical protein